MESLAIIQGDGGSGMNLEMQMLASALPGRGYALESMTLGELARKPAADLPTDCLIAGNVDFVERGMALMGIPVPAPNDYPDCLHHLLHREIWRSTFGALAEKVDAEEPVSNTASMPHWLN